MSQETKIEIAKQHLNAWMKAELAVSTAQSYSIGSRTLTRANLAEIMKQIQYWENQIAIIEQTGGRSLRRSKRFIPRDL